MRLVDDLQHESRWDEVTRSVPIFVEHAVYAVGDGEDEEGKPKTKKIIVLKGAKPPKGAKLVFEVTEQDLRDAADSINYNLEEFGKPIKLYFGHTKPPATVSQQDQPDIVGYGCNAKMGHYGPKKRVALLIDRFIKQGYGAEAKKYPERSPEYYPDRNEITGLALLKTDPRLPMGMTAYGHGYYDPRGAFHYGEGFPMGMNDPRDSTGKTAADVRSDGHDDGGSDGSSDDRSNPAGPNGDELSPDEAKQAMRFASHYERHHPAWKYMCDQHKKNYMADADANNGAVDTPVGTPPEEKPPVNKTEDPADDTAEKFAMEQRLRKMEEENHALKMNYARSEAQAIVTELTTKHRIKLKDPKAEVVRLASLSPKAREVRKAEIIENYQRDEAEPEQYGMIRTYGGQSGEVDSDMVDAEKYSLTDANEAGVIVEEKGLDPANERHWAQAMKEAKARRQAAV